MGKVSSLSRMAIVIVVVISLAAVGGALAYTASVMNSGNTAFAEYGLVSITNTDSSPATIQDIYSKDVTLKYVDQSSGKVRFLFEIYDIKDSVISDDQRYVTITLTPDNGPSVSKSAYLSQTVKSGTKGILTLLFDEVDVDANAAVSYTMVITISDTETSSLSSIFDEPHLTVEALHLGDSQ